MKNFCEKHGIEFDKQSIDIAGIKIFKNCPKCELEIKKENEAKEKEFASKQKEIKKDLFLKELEERGCNKHYLNKRDKLDYSVGVFNDLRVYLEAKDGDFLNKENALILGGCGIGKSFLAYKIIEVGLILRKNIRCFKLIELCNICRNSFGSFEKVENLIKYLDCLIIDEVDDCLGNETFKHLISFCYDKDIRVIILGNCDMQKFMSKLEPKTLSRINTYKVHTMKNIKDMRCQA